MASSSAVAVCHSLSRGPLDRTAALPYAPRLMATEKTEIRGRRAPAVLAAALALAGCGGGEDAAPPAETPEPVITEFEIPEQSDWAAKADAICVSYNEQIRVVQAAADPRNYEQELRNTIILAHDEFNALTALERSQEEAKEIADFLSAMKVRIVALEQLLDATEARDESRAVRAMARERAATERAQRYRKPLGLTACADPRLK